MERKNIEKIVCFFFGKFGEESFDFQNKWGDFINELKCILFC